MKKNTFYSVVIALILVLSLTVVFVGCAPKEETAAPATTTSAPEVFEWRYQIQHPAGDWIANPLSKELAKMIERNSDGRIQIEVFYAPELFSADESLENMQAGVIELGSWAGGYDKGKVPVVGFLDTPMTFPTADDFLFVYYTLGMQDLMREAYAPFGAVPLATQYGTQTILSKKPLRSIEDLKGLKMRTYGIFVDFFTELGAAPQYVSMAEIYTSIATGLLDAAHTNHATLRGQKVHELTNYYVEPPTNLGFNNFNVSQKALNELPNDLRKIVMLTGDVYSTWSMNLGIMTEIYEGPVKAFNDAGLTATTIPQSEWDKVKHVNDEILVDMAGDDPYALELLDIINEYYEHKAEGTIWDMVKADYPK